MSSDGNSYTHYVVLNDTILGEARIIEKCNEWVSLAFVKLGTAGQSRSTITPSSRIALSFPKS
jgi:hypothetical protein